MRVRCAYFKTMERDSKTGETGFTVTPFEQYAGMVDGLLFCRGIIPVFTKEMPLALEGEEKDGTFSVTDAGLLLGVGDDNMRLLSYACPDIDKSLLKSLAALDLSSVKERTKREIQEWLSSEGLPGETAVHSVMKVRAMLQQKEISDLLAEYDVPYDRIEAVVKRNVPLSKFRRNPYVDCLYSGISIQATDRIAMERFGIKAMDIERLKGYTMAAMLYSKACGNTCTTMEWLLQCVNSTMKKSACPEEQMNLPILYYCLTKLNIQFLEMQDAVYVYDANVYEEENTVIRHLARLNAPNGQVYEFDTDAIEEKLGIRYNEEQRMALNSLRRNGVKIITGPPGSGKTALVMGIVEAFRQRGRKTVRLSATTGRAAKVLSSYCGEKAETVNKMLDIRPFETGLSSKTENNPVEADLIIVDEVSMLGLQLASFLFKAVKTGCTLILVGDKDQLKSVDYGNVLEDLIESGMVEVYHLTKIMRQDGVIRENGQRINAGEPALTEDDTFRIIHCQTEEEALEKLLSNVGQGHMQVLSPVKGGAIGVRSLNEKLRPQRAGVFLTYAGTRYYTGDSVIMNQTDYEKGFINGDIGVIESISEDRIMKIRFADKAISLHQSELSVINLAYAITVHKFQGSEDNEIHILMPEEPRVMLTRRMLYTAVTRAKKKVRIYSVKDAIPYTISNNAERKRFTLLRYRLGGANSRVQK